MPLTSAGLVGSNAVSCVASVVLVVACRLQPAAPPRLRDPVPTAEPRTRQRSDVVAYFAAGDMPAPQVAALAAVYEQNPDDLVAIVLDPNVHIQASKALTCDIRPGRLPR